MQMKSSARVLSLLFILLCILLVVCLARESFLSLLSEFRGESESVGPEPPMLIVLFFGGALVVSFLFCALVLHRSFARIRRKEAEEKEKREEDSSF